MFGQGKLTKKCQRIRAAKSKKSATKRKVEVATSPTRKKRKSPDEANCEGLADGNAARSYRHGAGQWMLRISIDKGATKAFFEEFECGNE